MLFILVGILLLTLIYFYCIKPLTYWRENGVPQANLMAALFHNYFVLFKRKELTTFVNETYQKFPGNRYHGMYQFNKQLLVVKDTNLIKQMVIKDFEHFNEHRDFVPAEVDPLMGKNLFSLKGNEWRIMRSTLSPAFTSSKMKILFKLMAEYSQNFVEYFLNKNEDLIEIEMKDISSRFCNDVIASSAFGTEVDSFKHPDNEFFRYGQIFTDLRKFSTMIRLFFTMMCPTISKVFKIKFIPDGVAKFFTKLIEDTIKLREEKGIVRPDMIHLLMEARKGNQKNEENVTDTGFATVEEHLEGLANHNLTNEEIIAQALIFFFAGFDSVSTLMCFLAYELCVDQDIQNRLREEIEETSENCNNKITYEALVGMKYMDMVVTEALRKWPTQVGFERICIKPYTIEPSLPHEKPVRLTVGQSIFIPTYGIHHDPNNFPNPDVFDPERFSDENKTNFDAYAFQPFGLGPRNCIGSRFALMETKVMFFYLLKHFKIVPVKRTEIPIRHVKNMFSILPPDGFWMGLERIHK